MSNDITVPSIRVGDLVEGLKSLDPNMRLFVTLEDGVHRPVSVFQAQTLDVQDVNTSEIETVLRLDIQG